MPWAELDPTCFAGTFGRYCANPARVNECCGVCAVVPISFPGTVISFAIGSFFNLFFALVFRTEAPYNLLLQFLSVWGPTVSLVNSYFTSTNRLDLFSYCFVPLSICSCIPIAIAIALCRLEDLHVLSPDAALKLRAARQRASRQALPPGEDIAAGEQNGRQRPNSTRSDFAAWPEDEILPHRKLPGRVLWFYFGHMVAFTIVFLMVYIGVKNTHQENCNEKYEIDTFWRPLMGGFAGLNLVIGWLGWYILYQNIKVYYDENSEHHRVTAQSGVLWLLKITRNEKWAKKKSVGYGREERLRWAIALSAFLVWCVPYLTIWFKATHSFSMLGPNHWPFEQVGAATSVFIPFLICWRGIVDSKLQAEAKRDHHEMMSELHPDTYGVASPSNLIREPHNQGTVSQSGVLVDSRSHNHVDAGHQSIHRRESRRSRRDSIDGSIANHARIAHGYLARSPSSRSLA